MPATQRLTKPRSGGGLLLPRRKPPLTRRSVAYFCSGEHKGLVTNQADAVLKVQAALLDDENIAVREAAAKALRKGGDPGAPELMRRRLAVETDPDVKQQLVHGIAR